MSKIPAWGYVRGLKGEISLQPWNREVMGGMGWDVKVKDALGGEGVSLQSRRRPETC